MWIKVCEIMDWRYKVDIFITCFFFFSFPRSVYWLLWIFLRLCIHVFNLLYLSLSTGTTKQNKKKHKGASKQSQVENSVVNHLIKITLKPKIHCNIIYFWIRILMWIWNISYLHRVQWQTRPVYRGHVLTCNNHQRHFF